MDDLIAAVYAEVADEFLQTGLANPNKTQIFNAMSRVRNHKIQNEPQSRQRTLFIIVLNIEQAKLSKLIGL